MNHPSTQPARRPKAILFDHDGVLVASEPLHWAAWEELLDDLRIPYNNAEMRQFVGKTAPEIMLHLLNQYKPGWRPQDFDVVALAQRKNDFYLAKIATSLQAYDGVLEGLKWLRSVGVRTAVVSNSKRRELTSALQLLRLDQLLDAVVSRDDVSAPKPDPAPYLFGAATLGVAPASCFAVEDSPPGLEAALLAGIPTVGVLTNFNRTAIEQPVAGRADLRPIVVHASMREFFEWLAGLPA